jgi:ribosomal protein S1
VKPGFLVNAKVSKQFENGVELTFLGGLTGTCFVDHLAAELASYKVGSKVVARVISVDDLNNKIALSLKPHLVNLGCFEN